jgi:monothiol glutaredoxin
MSLDPALRARIESVLSANPVVLFLKGTPEAPQCGFSAKTAAALDATGATYAHVNVLADPEIRDGIKLYGDWPTIPQLYIHGELVGGCDIVTQMAASGELHAALGLPAPDRTPPQITITDAAAEMLKQALANAGEGYALLIEVDQGFNARLQLAPVESTAIATEAAGIRAQFDLVSAQRARGLTIDWADDARGKGLIIDNPNAPAKVKPLTPAQVRERVLAGSVTLVDVRPADERSEAEVPVAHQHFDAGMAALEALPKDTALAFICKAGGRSAQAAEHLRTLGFRDLYNVTGGITAWADLDATVPRY